MVNLAGRTLVWPIINPITYSFTIPDWRSTASFAPPVASILGGAGNDRLVGTARGDVLSGEGGNDVLDGRAGNDVLNGGDGVDTAVFAGTLGAQVRLNLAGRQRTGQGFDRLIGIENLTGGAGRDMFIGNGAANVLTGRGRG